MKNTKLFYGIMNKTYFDLNIFVFPLYKRTCKPIFVLIVPIYLWWIQYLNENNICQK